MTKDLYREVLSYRMTEKEALKAFVADKVLDYFNRSSVPKILAPTCFEAPLSRGCFQTVVMGDAFYLTTMDGTGRKYVLTESTGAIKDYLLMVYMHFTGTVGSLSQFLKNDNVKNFSKGFVYSGQQYRLLLPKPLDEPEFYIETENRLIRI